MIDSDLSNRSRSKRGISSLQLALLSRSVFDIPPRTRNLIAVAGAAGLVVLVVGSLIGGREQTVELDKVIHFSGYAMLAALFVLALRPVLYVPALTLLIGLGFLVEYLQSFTGRNMDLADGVANTIGVAVGAAAALLIRAVYAYVRRELAVVEVRRKLKHVDAGQAIIREGAHVKSLYVVKQGSVALSKMVDGKAVELGVLEAGDVLGALAVVLGTPQFATATAAGPTTLYRMQLDELMESAGGSEQPVCTVLRSLAESLRYAADRMVKTQARIEELALATETHYEMPLPAAIQGNAQA